MRNSLLLGLAVVGLVVSIGCSGRVLLGGPSNPCPAETGGCIVVPAPDIPGARNIAIGAFAARGETLVWNEAFSEGGEDRYRLLLRSPGRTPRVIPQYPGLAGGIAITATHALVTTVSGAYGQLHPVAVSLTGDDVYFFSSMPDRAMTGGGIVAAENEAYWVGYTATRTSSLYARIASDGSDASVVTELEGLVMSLGVDAQYVYGGRGTELVRIARSSGPQVAPVAEVERIAELDAQVNAVTSDETYVYAITNGVTIGGAKITRVLKSTGETELLAKDQTIGPYDEGGGLPYEGGGLRQVMCAQGGTLYWVTLSKKDPLWRGGVLWRMSTHDDSPVRMFSTEERIGNIAIDGPSIYAVVGATLRKFDR